MNRARETIKAALESAQSPAVMWSGGKDSMLLLAEVRKIAPSIPVIWFRSPNPFARRMIMEWDLEAWCWEPADVYVVPNEDGLTLVREQAFGAQRFPVLLDIEAGTQCIADVLPKRTPRLFPHFDVVFSGYRDSDYHWSMGGRGFFPQDGWTLGKARVVAPLRHLSDEQVWTEIKAASIPYDVQRYDNGGNDPDCVSACTQCLQPGLGRVFCPKLQTPVDRIQWNPAESLQAFRQRFGFKGDLSDG